MVVTNTVMMIFAMARLGRRQGAADSDDCKENEQAVTNHLQKENPKTDKPLGLLSAMRCVQLTVNFAGMFPA
ncbi:MAG: hypothetical protein V4734_02245 [Terriglobus sp.]